MSPKNVMKLLAPTVPRLEWAIRSGGSLAATIMGSLVERAISCNVGALLSARSR